MTTSEMLTAPPRRTRPTRTPTSITLLEDRGETGPVLTCQGCGVRITNYRRAGVAWRYSKSKRSSFRVYCKGEQTSQCLWNCARHDPFMELEAFFAYLLHNAGLDPTDYSRLRERIELGY